MEQNNNTIENEKCFISELMSLVEKESVDYAHQYICTETKMITPIGYMLPTIKEHLDKLDDLAERLCGCVGQVKLDDKHDWKDDDIRGLQDFCRLCGAPLIEREVYYNVDISGEDQSLLKSLEPIFAEETKYDYHNERDFIKERMADCLLRLNANDDEYTWKVYAVWYRCDEKRITLGLEAYRKEKDNAID